MSEQSAWITLRKNCFKPRDRVDRLENLVGMGFPDVNYCIDGKEGWIEIKAPKEPKKLSTPLFGSNHKVSVAQKNWFLRHQRAGGRGWLYIETDQRRILVPGSCAEVLNDVTVLQILAGLAVWVAPRIIVGDEAWTDLRKRLTDYHLP